MVGPDRPEGWAQGCRAATPSAQILAAHWKKGGDSRISTRFTSPGPDPVPAQTPGPDAWGKLGYVGLPSNSFRLVVVRP
jgi:hypothetical protein